MKSETDAILRSILEADEEDFDIKEVSPIDPTAGKTRVERHGRWKLVRMPDYTFLISYLTPVAYFDKISNKFYRSSKWWSVATEQHIRAWESMIWKSPEWQVPENMQKSEYGEGFYAKYPRFEKKPQKEISALFFKLMQTMEMKPQEKKRLYHVDPQMRKGSDAPFRSQSGHLHHHDSGAEGLPMRPGKGDVPGEFFKDFKPDEPELFDWDDGHGGRTYRPYEPDERGRRPKDE